ncbi:hypothetical protein DY000_02002762 [Brassica cretica]|uniref:Uncharacterized protein n=1 Tax=Brassica cretica TaxID=69181 RepID=A0ABQ7CDA4_BRACR|nr:hypothetical protein DY000_02002762 [Brassica cretica]
MNSGKDDLCSARALSVATSHLLLAYMEVGCCSMGVDILFLDVKHTPRVNKQMPDMNNATLDHELLSGWMATYGKLKYCCGCGKGSGRDRTCEDGGGGGGCGGGGRGVAVGV